LRKTINLLPKNDNASNMAQALPNPATMANEFQSSSQALANAAMALNNVSAAQNNLATEIARFPQTPAFQALQIQQQLTSIQTELRARCVNLFVKH
jgi:hypothetical protein